VNVTLEWRDGGQETIAVDPDETILDAASAADVALPFGCRRGTCSTCTGRLIDGDVDHRRSPRALKDRHLEAGYVLLCIAEPRSPCRVEVGSDVHADLVTNPWK
jgi:ferredoxin